MAHQWLTRALNVPKDGLHDPGDLTAHDLFFNEELPRQPARNMHCGHSKDQIELDLQARLLNNACDT